MKMPPSGYVSFARLVREWDGCRRCPLGQFANKTVLYRGSLNARVMFIGEGPGRSEDILGEPFVGRAGKLLDQAIRDAGQIPAGAFFTNLVACRPCDSLRSPNRPPEEGEIEKCAKRLQETIRIVRPACIVWLGKVPQFSASDFDPGKAITFFLPHPAWLLRVGGSKSDWYRKFVLNLREVYKYAS